MGYHIIPQAAEYPVFAVKNGMSFSLFSFDVTTRSVTKHTHMHKV